MKKQILLIIIVTLLQTFTSFAQLSVTKFDFTGDVQTFTVPSTGKYKLEVWGAQGGNDPAFPTTVFGGRGGYSTGEVNLVAGTILYLYVGGQGSGCTSSGWNSTGGGGSSDIRLTGGNWKDNAGLYSRIIVAGGGGGRHGKNYEGNVYFGNDGGGINSPSYSYTPQNVNITGATQTSSGTSDYSDSVVPGSFGYANPGIESNTCSIGGWNGGERGSDGWAHGGAGGGWYGGVQSWPAGSGGSGYVLTSSSVKPVDYTPGVAYYMENEQLIAGNNTMPDPAGGNVTGRSGNGAIVITSLYNVTISQTNDIVCDTETTAEIAATVNGGVAPFMYSWSPNVSTTSTASGLGVGTYSVTVTDANSLSTSTSFTIVPTDNIKPIAVAKNITVQLNTTGNVTVNGSDLNNGSTDNCGGIASYKIASAHTGKVCNVVNEGNILSLTAPSGVFTNVIFASYGTPQGSCGNFYTDWCDAPSSVSEVSNYLLGKTTADIPATNDVFVDPCGGTPKRLAVEAAYGPSISSATGSITYSCSEIGTHNVVLYVTDNNGNISSVNATITVEDTVLPTITCASIAASYNSDTGVCSYKVSDASLDPVATGNCTLTVSNNFNNSATLNGATFPLGKTTVIWTAKDASGKSQTCTYDITVVDAEKPTITCAVPAASYNNDLGVCSFTLVDNSLDPVAADNCSTVSVLNNFNNSATLNGAVFPVGTTTVTWTATDAAGNPETCKFDVVVVDAEAPVASAKDITVQLDATGNATIAAADVDNGSSDLCGAVTLSVTPNTFTCANIGDNAVTLTVTDANGNPSTTTAIVKVEDKVKPVVAVKNIIVQLDAAGNAVIQVSDIDDNSTDNCGIATIELNKTSFTCANVGSNTVEIKVTDIHGNYETKEAIVTVEDIIAPVVSTKNITVQLDPLGNATITGNAVDNGSADLCNGILTYSVSPNTFNCSNVGANTVTLTVTDASGNFDTATAIVTIEDKTAPIVLTKNITIQFDAAGNASIAAADVDNGSITVCGGALTLSVSPATFTCANAGANTVTLTATGINGVSSSEIAIVTLLESVAPIVLTKDITVQLDAAGNATITANQINNGSSDNCGIDTISLNKTSFDCTNVGINTVVLTVVDKSGNTASANAKVTVANAFGDNDNDGILDNCDTDDDNDGILDTADNCPITANPFQEDRNHNGIGDACDSEQMNISEAFTPNGDGINDTWVISNIENYPNSTVRVFNRWGAEVFVARNYQNDWDGHAKSISSTLPAASSYYYQIDLDGDGTIDRQGWIYINR